LVEDESARAGLEDGWGTPALSFLILGLVVGIPYYGIPFFYDYFEKNFGWSRGAVMLGLPLGTLMTLLIGPWLAQVDDLRRTMAAGGALCGLAVAGFAFTSGSLALYYACWILYMTGWTMSGPLAQQIVLGGWRGGRSGPALAVAYSGISFFGAISVAAVARPLTSVFGFRGALAGMGAIVALAGLAALGLPRRGHRAAQLESPLEWSASLWCLLAGSTLIGAAIGGVAQHLKLILIERGAMEQARVDALFGWCVMAMLTAGVAGRYFFGWAAHRIPKRGLVAAAVGLMSAAIAMLMHGDVAISALWAAPIFGFGLSADFLTVPLMAIEQFRSKKALGVLVPVNTLGQTWYPYAVALVWSAAGNYAAPMWMTQACLLAGLACIIAMRRPSPR
jgi:hypothetical protein